MRSLIVARRRGAVAGASRRMFSGRIATSTLSPALIPSSSGDLERELAGAISTVPPPSLRVAHLAGHQVHQPHEVGDHAVGGPGIDLERRAVLLQRARRCITAIWSDSASASAWSWVT